jgi:chaperonin GroES
MQITDKRRHDENGEAKPREAEHTISEQMQKFLVDVPCVYDDPSPMTNHVLVKQGQAETFYRGTKFSIPENARQSPNEGVVIAVGPDLVPEEGKIPVISPGDLVTFGRFNAEPIELDGQLFQLVSFHDIKLRSKVTYAIGQN